MTTALSRKAGDITSPAETFKAYELSSWNLSSEHYARSFATLTNKMIPHILDALELFPNASLLDICCGNGALAAAAHIRGANVVGLDFSEKMLELALAHHPTVRFEKGDAENLAVPNSCFDYASMSFGLVYLGEPEVAVHEAARILVESGRFAATVWDYPERTAGFALILRAIKELGEVEIDLSTSPDFFQFADTHYAVQIYEDAGFSSVEHQRVQLHWDLGSAEELFDAFFYGIGRTGSLLRAQPDAALVNIRRRIIEEARDSYSLSDGSIHLPMSAILYCAQK